MEIDFLELINLKTDLKVGSQTYLYICSCGVTNKYNKVYVHITYKVYVGGKKGSERG